MTDIDHATADRQVELMMIGGQQCRVSYGDQAGGRYVIVNYDEIRDWVLGLRPRAELIKLYNLGENK